MTIVEADRAPAADRDQRVYLRGTWGQYEELLAMRGESSVPRITFLRGVIELLSPSWSRDRIKKSIARLLEAYADERGLDLEGYGSWTVKSAAEERGAEADECYIVGSERKPGEVGRPDLAIEVVWTSGGLDKLDVYRGLGVGEVWFWSGGAITVHVLEAGKYHEVERSALLPELDLALVARLAAAENQRDAVRQLRDALRAR